MSKAFDEATEFFNKAFEELGLDDDSDPYAGQNNPTNKYFFADGEGVGRMISSGTGRIVPITVISDEPASFAAINPKFIELSEAIERFGRSLQQSVSERWYIASELEE